MKSIAERAILRVDQESGIDILKIKMTKIFFLLELLRQNAISYVAREIVAYFPTIMD